MSKKDVNYLEQVAKFTFSGKDGLFSMNFSFIPEICIFCSTCHAPLFKCEGIKSMFNWNIFAL